MRSMTERLRELGGRLEIDSGDRRTTVYATVPPEVLQCPMAIRPNIGRCGGTLAKRRGQ
jgi:hypothetical protein